MPPLDKVSEDRLTPLYPPFADMIRTLAGKLAFPIRVTQGLRTWEEQDVLYAQGRTTPGRIITNARGGWSFHFLGLAVDLVPMTDVGPDWNSDHPTWQKMIMAGSALGLTCGALFRTFPDRPHFQYTPGFPPTPTDEMRSIYKTSGVSGVWMRMFGNNGGTRTARGH